MENNQFCLIFGDDNFVCYYFFVIGPYKVECNHRQFAFKRIKFPTFITILITWFIKTHVQIYRLYEFVDALNMQMTLIPI